MASEHYRYYMEIRPDNTDTSEVACLREQDSRRRTALGFIQSFRHWLQENRLDEKVAALDVTPLGYVHITCEHDIIERARTQDTLNIGTIRQAAPLSESILRYAASAR